VLTAVFANVPRTRINPYGAVDRTFQLLKGSRARTCFGSRYRRTFRSVSPAAIMQGLESLSSSRQKAVHADPRCA
jgi:hypothetical protein